MSNRFTFSYIGSVYGKPCAFCGSAISVKYIATLDIQKHKCAPESIVAPATVYACNTCVAKFIEREC